MIYKIYNTPSVRNDIIEATNYYKKINPNLSKQFLVRLREAIRYISNSPEKFQLKYKQVRTLLLRQFPYHIHFLIDEEKRQVIILAIIHAYKNPTDYSNR
jgi:plasmid stabilization system protein ParE